MVTRAEKEHQYGVSASQTGKASQNAVGDGRGDGGNIDDDKTEGTASHQLIGGYGGAAAVGEADQRHRIEVDPVCDGVRREEER